MTVSNLKVKLILVICIIYFAGLGGKSFAAQNLENEFFDLERCVSHAMEYNLEIKSAEKNLEQVKGQTYEVMAIAMPNLSFFGSYTNPEEKESPFSLGSADSIDPAQLQALMNLLSMYSVSDDSYYTAEFRLTQSLFLGGRAIGAIQGANLTRKLYTENLRSTKNNITARVKILYYSYLFTQELLKVQEERLATLEHHFEIAKKKNAVGMVSPFEVLRAEVEAANVRPDIIEARNRQKIAVQNLKLAMGMDLEKDMKIMGKLEYRSFEAQLEDFISQALIERPDLRMADLQVKISQKQLVIDRAGFLPTLQGFFSYVSSDPNIENPGRDDWEWSYKWGFNLFVPLFDGMESYGKYYSSKQGIMKSRYERQQIAEIIKAEVTENYWNLRKAEEIILSQQKNIELAEEGLKIAETRYESGAGTQSEVMDSQVALTAARTNFYQALYSYQAALANLIKSVGGDSLGFE